MGRAQLSALFPLPGTENGSFCSAQSLFTQASSPPSAPGTVLLSSALLSLPLGKFHWDPKSSIPPDVISSILEVTPEHAYNLSSSSFLSKLIQEKSSLNLSRILAPPSPVSWYILERLQPKLYFFSASFSFSPLFLACSLPCSFVPLSVIYKTFPSVFFILWRFLSRTPGLSALSCPWLVPLSLCSVTSGFS